MTSKGKVSVSRWTSENKCRYRSMMIRIFKFSSYFCCCCCFYAALSFALAIKLFTKLYHLSLYFSLQINPIPPSTVSRPIVGEHTAPTNCHQSDDLTSVSLCNSRSIINFFNLSFYHEILRIRFIFSFILLVVHARSLKYSVQSSRCMNFVTSEAS